MGSKISKKNHEEIKTSNQPDHQKPPERKESEEIEQNSIRIDYVFPDFKIRTQKTDNIFQGLSSIAKMKSEYLFSKMEDSVLIQKISEEITIHRKFFKKLNMPVWVKKYKKTEENKKLYMNELLILANLSHPFISTEKDYFQDENFYYLILENYPGYPIMEYFSKNQNKIGFTQTKIIIRDLLNVLKYIHMKKIAIRNVSPENIYYDGDNLMICNFERATFFEDVRETDPKIKHKTLFFKETFLNKILLAPEAKKKNYSYQADIWGIGLIYLLFFAEAPKGLPKNIFNLRSQIIETFYPEFTLEKKDLAKFLKKKTMKKEKLEQLKQEESKKQKNSNSINLIIDLSLRTPYCQLLLEILNPNPKKRLSLEELEDQSIFQERIKLEEENSFMMASTAIYQFIRRNIYLTPLKRFYVKNLMEYEVKSKFAKIQNCFDLDGSGYLDKKEFILGVKRSSPETSVKEAKNIYHQIDEDNNGFIEFEEFCVAFIADEFITSQIQLKKLFEYFVQDEKRVVDKNDFFKKLQLTSKKYEKIRELASDQEELDLYEFIQFFRKFKSQITSRVSTDRRSSKFIRAIAIPEEKKEITNN